jgi:hypothetical protein
MYLGVRYLGLLEYLQNVVIFNLLHYALFGRVLDYKMAELPLLISQSSDLHLLRFDPRPKILNLLAFSFAAITLLTIHNILVTDLDPCTSTSTRIGQL